MKSSILDMDNLPCRGLLFDLFDGRWFLSKTVCVVHDLFAGRKPMIIPMQLVSQRHVCALHGFQQ